MGKVDGEVHDVMQGIEQQRKNSLEHARHTRGHAPSLAPTHHAGGPSLLLELLHHVLEALEASHLLQHARVHHLRHLHRGETGYARLRVMLVYMYESCWCHESC